MIAAYPNLVEELFLVSQSRTSTSILATMTNPVFKIHTHGDKQNGVERVHPQFSYAESSELGSMNAADS